METQEGEVWDSLQPGDVQAVLREAEAQEEGSGWGSIAHHFPLFKATFPLSSCVTLAKTL